MSRSSSSASARAHQSAPQSAIRRQLRGQGCACALHPKPHYIGNHIELAAPPRRAYREMQLAAIAGPVNEERAAQFHKEQICAIKS